MPPVQMNMPLNVGVDRGPRKRSAAGANALGRPLSNNLLAIEPLPPNELHVVRQVPICVGFYFRERKPISQIELARCGICVLRLNFEFGTAGFGRPSLRRPE